MMNEVERKREEYRIQHNLPVIEEYGFSKEHNPKSLDIYNYISELDFANGDAFCFKKGGDGDNGEMLMDLLDKYFEQQLLANNTKLIDMDAFKKKMAKWAMGGDPQDTEMVKLDEILYSVVLEVEAQPVVTVEEIRNAAIDEFVKQLKEMSFFGYPSLEECLGEDSEEYVAMEDILKAAEQFKKGGEVE